MKLTITGGGSGGHTIPAMTIYEAFVEKYSNQQDNFECIYIGSHDNIEKEVAQKKNIPYYPISTGKLRRYFSVSNFIDAFRILKGIIDSFFVLIKFRPHAVFSTGGFVSVPVVISSKILGIPVVIHEQTSSVGLANKIASYFAKKVAITFPSSKKFFPINKVVQTGQPIRKELFTGNKDRCYQIFNLDESLPLLYITGGSQGSHKINMTIKEIVPDLLQHCNIIHQCGKTQGHNDFEDLTQYKKSFAENLQKRYIVRDFIQEELKDILNGCSLLIGRSGAGTVNEAMALKIPSIFIPLAIATRNEQFHNAKMMESIGGAKIIEESELNALLLKEKILSIVTDENHKNEMISNLQSISNINATEQIVELILESAKKS